MMLIFTLMVTSRCHSRMLGLYFLIWLGEANDLNRYVINCDIIDGKILEVTSSMVHNIICVWCGSGIFFSNGLCGRQTMPMMMPAMAMQQAMVKSSTIDFSSDQFYYRLNLIFLLHYFLFATDFGALFEYCWNSGEDVNGHTILKALVPIWTPKLSSIGPG